MHLLNWDDLQSELSEDGAVDLPCPFGWSCHSIALLQGRGKEGCQSDS